VLNDVSEFLGRSPWVFPLSTPTALSTPPTVLRPLVFCYAGAWTWRRALPRAAKSIVPAGLETPLIDPVTEALMGLRI
jgi:hypothetical protein